MCTRRNPGKQAGGGIEEDLGRRVGSQPEHEGLVGIGGHNGEIQDTLRVAGQLRYVGEQRRQIDFSHLHCRGQLIAGRALHEIMEGVGAVETVRREVINPPVAVRKGATLAGNRVHGC
ncbi:hypothetical protein SDC9_202313 [bioreactor metagenome]|uniref:Uncharacterized protein n=1 Tax=bioreactor metagenome TaxID=1076179 RepID=A0A645ITA9_9ZZZZ